MREDDFASMTGTFVRRWRAFVAIFVIFLGIVLMYSLLWPKSYVSHIKLISGSSNPEFRGANSDLPILNALTAAMGGQQSNETYAELLSETPIAQQVANDLHLNTSAHQLLKHVTVKPVTQTQILDVAVEWPNAQMATKIANAFGTTFITRERDLLATQAGSAQGFLSEQIPRAEAAMHRAESDLARFQAAHPSVYVGASADGQGSDSAVFTAQQKLAQVQVDAGQAQAQLANVVAQMSSLAPTINAQSNVVQNPVSAQLRTQLAQVDVQLESARKQFTEQHPTVQALEQQKAQLEREISSLAPTVVAGNNIEPNPVYQQLNQQAATLRSQIAGDQAQIGTLTAELGQMNGPLNSLPAATMKLANLQRRAKMAQDVYTALMTKYNDAEVAKTAALSDVAITEYANPASVQIKPDPILTPILGAFIGLILAISGVFVIDFFDNTFKDERDVERVGLPILASIPQLNGKQHKNQKSLSWLRSMTIESFIQLVTAVRYSSDKPLKTIAITSPLQGDGKSTIALNTAAALAEMQPRVLLVDADLRRPSVHEKLGLSNDRGLSDVLVGLVPLADAIQPTKHTGLDILSCGRAAPNPMALLQSQQLVALLEEMGRSYQTIILDTPALLPMFDAAIVAGRADGCVLVVSAGRTNARETKQALDRLMRVPSTNVLGVVLNRASVKLQYGYEYLNDAEPLPLPIAQ
ncbi:MAG: polysaccharide biosynthesis tyrosine autokinase [Candidatus Eremiobacteraeota bacterium]|nr:polysaccharide biosynthesis tyrosine autokinase [Candidatus Eremiobacteraeota bacterium]